MKLFSSQSADGRRLFATGLPLPADARPGPAGPAPTSCGKPSCRPRNRVGGRLISKPSQALSLSPGLADGPV